MSLEKNCFERSNGLCNVMLLCHFTCALCLFDLVNFSIIAQPHHIHFIYKYTAKLFKQEGNFRLPVYSPHSLGSNIFSPDTVATLLSLSLVFSFLSQVYIFCRPKLTFCTTEQGEEFLTLVLLRKIAMEDTKKVESSITERKLVQLTWLTVKSWKPIHDTGWTWCIVKACF